MAKHFRETGKSNNTNLKGIKIAALAAVVFALFFFLGALIFRTPSEKSAEIPEVQVTAEAEVQEKAPSAFTERRTVYAEKEKFNLGTEKITEAYIVTEENSSEDKHMNFIKTPEPDGIKRVAIIVDDGGFNPSYAEEAAKLDLPLTWAVIPSQKHSERFVTIAKDKNIPYLVHMPMQAISDKKPEKGAIGEGMSSEEIKKKINEAFDLIPGAVGLNNHRGSLATSRKEIISPVIDVISEKGVIFVDSNTYSKTVGYETAKEKGVRTYKNNGFLDTTADKNMIREKFNKVISSNKRENLVLICHFRPETIKFLKELNKEYRDIPITFVTIPELH